MRIRTRVVPATAALAMLFVGVGCYEDVITRPGSTLEVPARPSVSAASVTDEAVQVFRAPDAQALSHFGSSVAAVGENIVIGASTHNVPGAATAGKVYLFHQDGTLLRTFQAPDPQAAAIFGGSVAGVGENVLIGAFQQDVDGLSNAGQAYLFDQNGALLQVFQAPDPKYGAHFGRSVAGVGENVVVGADQDGDEEFFGPGRAYLFDQNGSLLQTLQAPDASELAHFGHSVAAVGQNILAGAFTQVVAGMESAGKAYLFDLNGTVLQTFQSPNPQPSGQFGRSVAAVGENILVGAPFERVDGVTWVGHAYLFDQNGNLLRTFQSPDPRSSVASDTPWLRSDRTSWSGPSSMTSTA